MNKLNNKELIVGAVLGSGFFWYRGILCIPLALITSLLWALGGAGALKTKALRRIGIPLVLSIYFIADCSQVIWAGFLMTFAILSIGYGVKSTKPPDEGSLLGNFCYELLGETLGEWLSRFIIVSSIWTTWLILYLSTV